MSWAFNIQVFAFIAGLLGFTAVAGTAIEIAKILFFLFLILCVLFLLPGRRPSV